jgi:hypothetical protein
MRANHTTTTIPWNGQEITLKAGQFIFGRHQAAEDLGMKRSTVRNQMALLQELGNLDIKSDSRFSLVTVCNWNTYQGDKNEKGQREGHSRGHRQEGKKKIDDDEVVFKNEFFSITRNMLEQFRKAYPRVEKLFPEFARVTDVLKEKVRRGEVISSAFAFLHTHLKRLNDEEKQKGTQHAEMGEGSRGVGPVPIAEVLHGIRDDGQ